MRHIFTGILFLWLMALFTLPTFALDVDEVAIMKKGTVKVFVWSKNKKGKFVLGSGTGFILNEAGYIATNHHVISGYAKTKNNTPAISVSLNGQITNPYKDYKKGNIEVIWSSKPLDLAILKFNTDQKLHTVVLSTQPPNTAEPVYAVGYPGASGDNELRSADQKSVSTMTKGIFSHEKQGQWSGNGGTLSILQHNAEISWGNSGGPLFDDCQQVIGVNTRLTIRHGTVTPGVFMSSNISELIKILDSRGIEYEVGDGACVSKENRLYGLMQNIVIIGGGAILVLGIILIFALKRPRERVVQLVESYSRNFRSQEMAKPAQRNSGPRHKNPPNNAPRPQNEAPQQAGQLQMTVTLEGSLSNGTTVRLSIDGADLMQGVFLGRQPQDNRFAINDMGISRTHAVIYYHENFVKIRDEGSTNGTRVNGRVLRPRQEQSLANGDEIYLGDVYLKVSIR